MTVKNRLGYALLAGLAIAGLSPQAMSLPLGSREPQLSGKAALATDAGTACVECASGSQRIAWLVWGRRGKSKAVAPTAFSWPAGHKWPDDALSPARWGKIALAAMPASAEAQGSEVLVAAPGELAIAADGILSHREWDLALANVQSTAAGPMLTVAQWKDNALALAIAFPAIPTLSPRTKAVLVLGPPTPDTSCLPPTARAYAIQWDARRQVSVLEIAHPDRGNWKWRPVTGSSEEGAETTFRGAIAGSGDGGLQFVSAEFLVPLVG
ncbi:MAG: hypothetical protein H5T86_14875, partial [Armatimonadetes bacterium]|nr:hypothetical protein [Armatimonadota bacterium]